VSAPQVFVATVMLLLFARMLTRNSRQHRDRLKRRFVAGDGIDEPLSENVADAAVLYGLWIGGMLHVGVQVAVAYALHVGGFW